MAHVTEPEVQQWLEITKLDITTVDAALEATASTIALAQLSEVYDVTIWTDETTTPALVRKAISMLIAAWIYQRQYSEEDPSGSTYAKWLEDKAYALLTAIASGSLDLVEVSGIGIAASSISFEPNDLTGSSQVYDEAGNAVGLMYSESIKFRVGMRW